ncbi:MAG: HAMP domain-containing histidine kinase, partial [Arcobacteraceae bacterium]|nr:HAMP domain-containing histidine kinase [Arcobacteraceae bacterium]
MEKDIKIDSQKEKLTLLGEMFENIIHQFKQPLNAITTEATGIKFQHEMDMITDEILYESLDNIISRARYLSDTIDDFRNFLQEDKEKIIFKIAKNIQKIEFIINPILKAKGIEVYKTFQDDDIECNGYDREFSQVIINILNNSQDAILLTNPDKKI